MMFNSARKAFVVVNSCFSSNINDYL